MRTNHTCPTCGQPVTPTTKDERPMTLRLRVSSTEKLQLRQAAEENGQTVSRYIRDRIF